MSDTLVLGAFSLTQPASAGRAGVEAEGTSKGAPVPVEVAVRSWLQDGSIVVTQGYDNRDVPIRVRLWASTLAALNAAEAALFAELGHPNLLTWTPSSGPATVFVVITSSFAQDDTGGNADLLESQRLIRTYNIRLTCEAFTRSVTETVATTLPTAGATTTNLDTCAATTGWTGTYNGGASSPSVVSGAVVVSGGTSGGAATVTAQKTFAATTTVAKLLVTDWKPSVPGPLVVTGDGVILPLVAEGASPTSGFIRSWHYVAAASLAVTNFSTTSDAGIVPLGATPTRSLSIDNVQVTNQTFPTVGTGRQQLRSVTITGSACAPGSLAVESATAALGDAMVYVYESDDTTRGYVPSLRQFRSAGNTVTTDAAMVSGAKEPMNGSGVTLSVPMLLFPRGLYALVVRVAYDSGIVPISNLTLTRSTTLGSTTIAAAATVTQNIPVNTSYSTLAMARFQLPTSDLDPKTPAIMALNLTEATGHIYFDEAWLFNLTLGQLTWVDCGTGAGAVGGAARRLFLEPATPTSPRPTLRIGHSADRSDSYGPTAIKAWQAPTFPNGQVNILAVTPGATDAVITPRFYSRWHTNPSS